MDDRERGPSHRDRDPEWSPRLEELDRALRRLRFRPRPSLQAKILTRHASHRPRRHGHHRYALIGTAAAALLVMALWWAGHGPRDGDPVVWSTSGHETPIRLDHCCADLDGGLAEDDGVLILVGSDEAVLDLLVYEDRDGSGTYSPGDPVRLAPDHLPEPGVAPGSGLVTLDRCCLDYDAGGPADDGLYLVGHPPDRLLMAALYEDRDGNGIASPGDLVRYLLR